MAKKSKQNAKSKEALSENSAWFAERLEQSMLDIEALSSLDISDVNKELKSFKTDQRAFVESLNAKLPEGAAIPMPPPARKPRRKSAATAKKVTPKVDRLAVPPTPARRPSTRIFSLKGALFVSLLVIVASIAVPRFIKGLNENEFKQAVAVEGDSTKPDNTPPTWLEGPAPDEMIRGIKYRIEGLNQSLIAAPLPQNTGSLQARFRFRMTIDAQGAVTGIEPISVSSPEMETAVIDSLLNWQFGAASTQETTATDATVTVQFIPWE